MTKGNNMEIKPALPRAPELKVEQTQHSKWAALTVTIASMLIIGGVLAVLHTHLNAANRAHVQPLNASQLILACAPNPCSTEALVMMMEQDAQVLRSERFRNAINSRMAIYVIAEIVALMLVALGSVLIFDRIKADTGETASFGKIKFTSAWPGAMLCFFGTAILGYALFLTVSPGYRLSIWDRPVFVTDPNWARNVTQRFSGHGDDPIQTGSTGQGLETSEVEPTPEGPVTLPDLPPSAEEDTQ